MRKRSVARLHEVPLTKDVADYAIRLIHPTRLELLHYRKTIDDVPGFNYQPIVIEAMQVPECSLDAAVGKQAGWVVCMLFHN